MTGKAFNSVPDDASSPTREAVAVTQSDVTNDPNGPFRALNVAAAGVVRVTNLDGSTVDLYLAAGIQFGHWCKRVHSTGTTATGIIGMK